MVQSNVFAIGAADRQAIENGDGGRRVSTVGLGGPSFVHEDFELEHREALTGRFLGVRERENATNPRLVHNQSSSSTEAVLD